MLDVIHISHKPVIEWCPFVVREIKEIVDVRLLHKNRCHLGHRDKNSKCTTTNLRHCKDLILCRLPCVLSVTFIAMDEKTNP